MNWMRGAVGEWMRGVLGECWVDEGCKLCDEGCSG